MGGREVSHIIHTLCIIGVFGAKRGIMLRYIGRIVRGWDGRGTEGEAGRRRGLAYDVKKGDGVHDICPYDPTIRCINQTCTYEVLCMRFMKAYIVLLRLYSPHLSFLSLFPLSQSVTLAAPPGLPLKPHRPTIIQSNKRPSSASPKHRPPTSTIPMNPLSPSSPRKKNDSSTSSRYLFYYHFVVSISLHTYLTLTLYIYIYDYIPVFPTYPPALPPPPPSLSSPVCRAVSFSVFFLQPTRTPTHTSLPTPTCTPTPRYPQPHTRFT